MAGHQVQIIEYVQTATLDILNYSNSIFVLAKESLELLWCLIAAGFDKS